MFFIPVIDASSFAFEMISIESYCFALMHYITILPLSFVAPDIFSYLLDIS